KASIRKSAPASARCADKATYLSSIDGHYPSDVRWLWPGRPASRPASAAIESRPCSTIYTARLRQASDSRDTVCMATVTYQGHEVLFSRQQIAARVAEMGAQIANDLNG